MNVGKNGYFGCFKRNSLIKSEELYIKIYTIDLSTCCEQNLRLLFLICNRKIPFKKGLTEISNFPILSFFIEI